MPAITLVFARSPIPGRAKTRLIPALGMEGAARLHAALVWHTVAKATTVPGTEVHLCCTPGARHPLFAELAHRFPLQVSIQHGAGLGERMHHAIVNALNQGRSAVLVGTDCPDLGADDIASAHGMLATGQDAVLGPATDGGYYLIGLRRAQASIFSGIPWGTERVLELTRERLAAAGLSWSELPTRRDVDTPRDLDWLSRVQPELLAGLGLPGPGRRAD